MLRHWIIILAISIYSSASSQNVGVGTTTPSERFHVVGNRALFETNFFGIGAGNPLSGFTAFQLNSNANTFHGMYINTGPSGVPFYGYGINGLAKAYTSFNSATNQLEYHQTSDAVPDFYIKGNTQAGFNTGFLEIGPGTGTPITGFTGLQLTTSANTFRGMYINTGATGVPFYGYALNGTAKSYTSFNSANNQFEYHQTSDATPDFFINGNTRAGFNTGFLGIGAGNPVSGFTAFQVNSSANSFHGMYINSGVSGVPFYGYALNGTAKAYTSFNSANDQFEYHQSSDATPDFFINGKSKAVFNTDFLGVGTNTPTTAFTGFALKSTANDFFGTYVDAGSTGKPFYGYALNGVAKAYTSFNGVSNQFEYHHTSDATPDFSISNSQVSFPIQSTLTIGTNIPFNSATGLTLKNLAATGYYGMYIEAGATGNPFYGYAANGVVKAYTQINGSTDNWELVTGFTSMVVTQAGNVGIGTALPNQKLDVNGTIHASNLNGGATTLSTDASGNIIRTPSDARLKKDVEEIKDPLGKLKQMHGVTYNFKDAQRFGSNRQMGFLAQELEEIVPEAVSSGGQYKSVNYPVLTALLTEAVKTQQKQIELLEKEMEELKNKFNTLAERLDKVENPKK